MQGAMQYVICMKKDNRIDSAMFDNAEKIAEK